MGKHSYSLEDIRGAYQTSEGVGFYSTSLMVTIFRPISFYIAWFFLKFGISANQTTFVSLVFVISGCFSYVMVAPFFRWIPLVLVLTWATLDYVDGNIARVTCTLSRYGDFIDVLGAYFFLAFLPICMGIGLYRYPENSLEELLGKGTEFSGISIPGLVLILGSFASLNNILLRLIVMRMNTTFGLDARQAESLPGKKASVSLMISIIESAASPRGFYFPALIFATIFAKLEWFLGFYSFFYSGALFVYTIWYIISLRNQTD